MAKTWKVCQPEPARFPSYRVVDDAEKLVALVPIMADNKPTEALALIAAAPEMLEALKAALRAPGIHTTDQETGEVFSILIENAIAKAEGRT